MKLIEQKENQMIFNAKIEESLANAIRRYFNQIPVLAIDEVEIVKNDSALYDETLAHRIGLVPLKMDKKMSEKTTTQLKLKIKKEGMVYSGELKGDTEIVYSEIPLTFLEKDKNVEIVATTKIGYGKDHAKFSPGLMFYRNAVDIKIEKDCPQEVIESCPQDILKIQNNKVIVENLEKCDLCDSCIDFCKKQDKDSIKINPTEELIITVETFGQLDSKEIFKKAAEALKKDLIEFSKKIK